MHFMPHNNLEENVSHFILITPTKKNLPPKIAFQILGTQKLHLGNQVLGSRKFSCPVGSSNRSHMMMPYRRHMTPDECHMTPDERHMTCHR